MLFILGFLFISTLVQAATLFSCRGTCFTDAIASTGCSSKDTHCICASDDFMNTLSQCVQDRCSAEESAGLISYAGTFCNTVASVQKKRDFRFPWTNPSAPAGPKIPNMQPPSWAPFGKPTLTTPPQGDFTPTAAAGWPGPPVPHQTNWWQPPNVAWPPRPEQTVW